MSRKRKGHGREGANSIIAVHRTETRSVFTLSFCCLFFNWTPFFSACTNRPWFLASSLSFSTTSAAAGLPAAAIASATTSNGLPRTCLCRVYLPLSHQSRSSPMVAVCLCLVCLFWKSIFLLFAARLRSLRMSNNSRLRQNISPC